MIQGNYGDRPPFRTPPPGRLKSGDPGNDSFIDQQELAELEFEFELRYSQSPDPSEVNINVYLVTHGYKIVSHAVEALMDDALTDPEGNIFVRLDIEEDPTETGFHYNGQINNVHNPIYGTMVPWSAVWGSIEDHIHSKKIYGKLLSVPNL